MFNNRWINIQKLKNSLSNALSRRGKAIVLAVAASLFIGSIFGAISLQMADEEDGMKADTINNTVNVSGEQEGAKSTYNADSLSFYVIQAGVFNKEANAEEWLESFKEAGYPKVKWEKDQEIYLLTGISANKKDVKKIASEMKEKDFDVFVKEWEVEAVEQDMKDRNAKYIKTFLTSWKKSLQEMDGQPLKNFIKENEEIPEELQPFQKMLKKSAYDEDKAEQEILLETIYMYENIFENESK